MRNLRLNVKKRLIMIGGKSFAAQMEVEMNDKMMELVSALKHLEDCSTKAGGLHDDVKISGLGSKNLCCKIFHVQYKECEFRSNERVEGGVVVQAVVHGS